MSYIISLSVPLFHTFLFPSFDPPVPVTFHLMCYSLSTTKNRITLGIFLRKIWFYFRKVSLFYYGWAKLLVQNLQTPGAVQNIFQVRIFLPSLLLVTAHIRQWQAPAESILHYTPHTRGGEVSYLHGETPTQRCSVCSQVSSKYVPDYVSPIILFVYLFVSYFINHNFMHTFRCLWNLLPFWKNHRLRVLENTFLTRIYSGKLCNEWFRN